MVTRIVATFEIVIADDPTGSQAIAGMVEAVASDDPWTYLMAAASGKPETVRCNPERHRDPVPTATLTITTRREAQSHD